MLETAAIPELPAADAVLPLVQTGRAPASPSPWENLKVGGVDNMTVAVTLAERSAVRAALDVYASAHGCEEFWYSNVPSSMAVEGECSGGAYREIEVLVDGHFAGAAFPFPTIYTGGVCPILWRPLTGLHSFNVPPLTFDLSPFVGLLDDGQPHHIAVRVATADAHEGKYAHGTNGSWYLNPVLRLWNAPDGRPRAGRVVSATRERPNSTVTVRSLPRGSARVLTDASSSFDVVGEVWEASEEAEVAEAEGAEAEGGAASAGLPRRGDVAAVAATGAETRAAAAHAPPAGRPVRRYVLSGCLAARNNNSLLNDTLGFSAAVGQMEAATTATVSLVAQNEPNQTKPVSLVAPARAHPHGHLHGRRLSADAGRPTVSELSAEAASPRPLLTVTSRVVYPYSIGSRELLVPNVSLSLEGNVTLGKTREEHWQGGGRHGGLRWTIEANHHAVYKRTDGTTAVNRTILSEAGEGHTRFHSEQACVTQAVRAADGAVVHAELSDECIDQPERRMLCEAYDECAAPRDGVSREAATARATEATAVRAQDAAPRAAARTSAASFGRTAAGRPYRLPRARGVRVGS